MRGLKLKKHFYFFIFVIYDVNERCKVALAPKPILNKDRLKATMLTAINTAITTKFNKQNNLATVLKLKKKIASFSKERKKLQCAKENMSFNYKHQRRKKQQCTKYLP